MMWWLSAYAVLVGLHKFSTRRDYDINSRSFVGVQSFCVAPGSMFMQQLRLPGSDLHQSTMTGLCQSHSLRGCGEEVNMAQKQQSLLNIHMFDARRGAAPGLCYDSRARFRLSHRVRLPAYR
jgi:hypothetical protein